jgi:hypothetical protein
MAPWNPIQFLQQKAAEAQRTVQRTVQDIPRMAGDIYRRNVEPIVRPAVRAYSNLPPVRAYSSLPPAIRSGINPLSRATPVGLRGMGLSLGTNLIADTLISEAANALLPKKQAAEVIDFTTFTSSPFGGPAARLAAYAVLRPTPVGAGEDEKMAQIRREFEESKLRASEPRQDLQLAAPAQPAFRAPGVQTRSVTPAISSSPRQASATPSVPSVLPAAPRIVPSAVPPAAPEIGGSQVQAASPLAEQYAREKRLGELLGAQEMIRRLNQGAQQATEVEKNLQTWAEANPALAYREMLRREQAAL